VSDVQPVSPPYGPPTGDPTDVLGRRFAALAIDLVLLGAIAAILFAVARHTSIAGAPKHTCDKLSSSGSSVCVQIGGRVYSWDRGTYAGAVVLSLLAGFLDLVLLQTLMGASVGKLFVGLRVIEQPGNEARFLRMLGRWVFLIVDLGCFLVGLVSTLVTHPHRRVGDLVCGTYVVATSSVGVPVIVATYPPPEFGAPPPGYAHSVPGHYPAGWGGPAGWTAPPVVTPPGTAPTTPGEWGAVARPAPPLVRSPQWQEPPPGTPQPVPESRQSMAPQWATPPVPTADQPEAPADARAGDGEPVAEEAAIPETIVTQWSPVVPLTNNSSDRPLAAPVSADPPAPGPAAAISHWSPVVPAEPSDGASTPDEPTPPPVSPPTPPAPTPPTEPPPAPPTEPPPPPPAAEEDDVPWWEE
jgi:uncharacterized RDD family membrane protein YckC